MMYTLFERPGVFILGHRGCSEFFPENTMAAFEDCAKDPDVDGVELDVQLTADGYLVVAHDETLARTAGVDRYIDQMTWKEIKDLDVGSFKDPSFADQRVPLLDDVLGTFGNRFVYDIELKVRTKGPNKKLCFAVWDTVCAHSLQENVMVSSFSPFALRRFNRACWYSVPTADIFMSGVGPRFVWNGGGHFYSGSSYQKPCIENFRKGEYSYKDLDVIAWTVNTPEDAAFLLDHKEVKGLIGNNPHMLATVYKEKNEKK